MKELKENININNLSKDKKKKFKLPKPSTPVKPLKPLKFNHFPSASPLVVFQITISPTITFLKDHKIKDATHLINSQITDKKSFFQVFDTHLLAYTINHLNNPSLSLDNIRQTEFFRAHKKLLLERGHILINDIQFSIVKPR